MSARRTTTTRRATTRTSAAAAPADPAPAAPADPVGVPVLRTDAEKSLWAALAQYPGTTAAELADAAGMARSTARRILSGWATTGTARRDRDPDNPRAAEHWTATPSPTPDTGTATADTATPPDSTPEPPAPVPAPAPEPDTSDPAPQPATDADPSAPGTDTDGPTATDATQAAVAAPPADRTADPATTPDSGPDTAVAQPKTTVPLAPGALRGQVEDYLRDHPNGEFSPHHIGKALTKSSGAVNNALEKLTATGVARKTSDKPKRFTLA